MKRYFFNVKIFMSFTITLIVLLLLFSGCGVPFINMEGVELEEIKSVDRDIVEDEKDLESTPEGSLAIGSFVILGKFQVEFEEPNPILWKVIENKSHYKGNVTPDDKHMTLLSEYVIDIRGFDAKEPENKINYIAQFGYNSYPLSNIRQWLNSNKKANEWWEPQHDADGIPNDQGFESTKPEGYPTGYDDNNGFLYSFNSNEISLLLDTNLECGINNDDGGGTNNITDKVFLLSLTEVGLGKNEGNNYLEGSPFVIFTSDESRFAYVSEQCVNNTKSIQRPADYTKQTWSWWLRSPYTWSQYDTYLIDTSGIAQNRRTYKGGIGVRPTINIKYEGLAFSGNGTIDNPYIIK